MDSVRLKLEQTLCHFYRALETGLPGECSFILHDVSIFGLARLSGLSLSTRGGEGSWGRILASNRDREDFGLDGDHPKGDSERLRGLLHHRQ